MFHGDVTLYTHLMACAGAGAVTGALVVAWLGKFPHMGRDALMIQIVFGVLIIAFAIYAAVLAQRRRCCLPAGACMVMVFSMLSSLVQLNAPNEMRGRVMSIYMVAFRGGMPLGSLVGGWIANADQRTDGAHDQWRAPEPGCDMVPDPAPAAAIPVAPQRRITEGARFARVGRLASPVVGWIPLRAPGGARLTASEASGPNRRRRAPPGRRTGPLRGARSTFRCAAAAQSLDQQTVVDIEARERERADHRDDEQPARR